MPVELIDCALILTGFLGLLWTMVPDSGTRRVRRISRPRRRSAVRAYRGPIYNRHGREIRK